jgi:ubiquinol-cytochrome c reductase cytochrome b subunit
VTWLAGVVLLVVMVGMFFTGTVMKWDQEAWEALQHNQEIGELLGGLGVWFTPDFTSSTPILQRLFVAHVSFLIMLLLGFLLVHFLLVKHHGISSLPGHEEQRLSGQTDAQRALQTEGSVTFANHLKHVFGWGLLLSLVVAVLAQTVSAPLGAVINPGEEITKPPWLFLPLYAFEDWFGVRSLAWVPALVTVALLLVPFIDRYPSSSLRRRWVRIAAAALVIIAALGLGIYAGLTPVVDHLAMQEGG